MKFLDPEGDTIPDVVHLFTVGNELRACLDEDPKNLMLWLDEVQKHKPARYLGVYSLVVLPSDPPKTRKRKDAPATTPAPDIV